MGFAANVSHKNPYSHTVTHQPMVEMLSTQNWFRQNIGRT